jgi:N-acetylglucosaminyldiphosphoundecaprenol N-acetyl-beta-D-mannosaminyltransferase
MRPAGAAQNSVTVPSSCESQGAQLRSKLAPDPIDTVALFGLPISNVTMQEAVDRVERAIQSGHVQQIATANLDFARNSLRDPYLHRIICECNMVLPDGAPMLWASRIFRAPLRERVTGVDLIPELASLSQKKGYGIFFLGSSEESSQRAATVLTERFPGVRIVDRYSPPMAPLQEMNHEEIIHRIREARPDVVFVGFGNPKQEIWIHRHKDRLPPAVYIGIGGALDMIGGKLRRAPRWVQKLQLEWFYRMSQEPLRLLPRYVHDAAALVTHLPMGIAANCMQPFERRQRGSAVDVQLGFRVFATPGKIGGRASALLVNEAKAAAAAGESLIIDLAATLRLEAEGLGGLLEARRIMLEEGQWIWLTSMSNSVRRVLQFSAMADLFRVAVSPAAAIQSTRSAHSGLRMAYNETHVGVPRPVTAATDPVPITARAS